MLSSTQNIETVNKNNEYHHVLKWRRRRLRKSVSKAIDRRKNFEQGELSGFLYWIGLFSIAVAASGYCFSVTLTGWQRILIAVFGVVSLIGKTYIKRRFWRETEDAVYKEEIKKDDIS